MPEILNADGTWTEITRAELIERIGEEAYRACGPAVPPTPIEELDPDIRRFVEKMQSQHEVNAALDAAGIESIHDLIVEGDPPEVVEEKMERWRKTRERRRRERAEREAAAAARERD